MLTSRENERPVVFGNFRKSRLLNFDGDVYIEARVGLNPLAHGYCVCASAKQAEWNKEP